MLTPTNEAVTVVDPVWIDHSNRNGGFVVLVAATGLIVDHLPTMLVNRLTVALDSDQVGDLIVRKWFCGGTLFYDDKVLAIGAGINLFFFENMLETCQILFKNTGIGVANVIVTEIGRV